MDETPVEKEVPPDAVFHWLHATNGFAGDIGRPTARPIVQKGFGLPGPLSKGQTIGAGLVFVPDKEVKKKTKKEKAASPGQKNKVPSIVSVGELRFSFCKKDNPIIGLFFYDSIHR